MKYTLKTLLLLVLLLSTVICLQSCKKEQGCTDINAENYSADAEEDDGSCTYSRTKFLGTYGAGESCGGAPATSQIVKITESSVAYNAVSVTNETLGVTVTGYVSGNTLTIDDTFVLNGASINMEGEGTYSSGNNEERIDINYTLNTIQACIGIWLKS